MAAGKSFIYVLWHHDHAEEPVKIISEIVSGIETRKIEIYRDGRIGFADANRATGGSILSEGIMPSLVDINAQAEFSGEQISEAAFAKLWSRYVEDE